MAPPTSSATPAARRSPRRARGSLSEDEILDGALQLVVSSGFVGLSMPALARQLGSGVTSIYWYFRSKDELLDTLAERVARDAQDALPPLGDGPWHEVLVEHLLAVRQLLEDRPWYREILARSFLFDAAAPAMFDDPVAAARLVEAAGIAPADARRVVEDLAAYTRGFIVLEHRLEADDAAAESADRLRHVEPTAYPTLGRLPDFIEVMWLGHEQCAYGLRLLVAGIRSRHGR
jgi:AcrR family transcriptional regulator